MQDGSAVLVGFAAIWVVMALLALASLVVWIWAIVDCAQREFPQQETKIVWILVIVLVGIIGALVYLVVGRPQGYRR